GLGEEQALGNPRIRSEQFVQGVRPKGGRLLEEFRRMSRAAEVSGDDDHVAGLRAGPQEDPVLPYASEGRSRDREDRRFLRVAPEDGDAELARAFLDALRQAAEELD